MKTKLLILTFLTIPFWNFGQNCGALMEPVSLEVRASEATKIIEGEVIDSQSLWDANLKNIYTIYTVNIYTNMKGSNTSTSINVVTMGGQVGDAIQVTSSEANLQVGTVGTFFLKNFTGNLNASGTLYQMVAAAQGIIKYDKFKDEASDVFNTYNSIENKLYNRIQQATGRSFQTIQARPSRTTNTNKSFLATPTVYSFSPLTATAGTQTILTLTGINFGTTQGTVGFSYASDGGASHVSAADSEVVSWSDTEIQVEIPYFAGTGTIIVTNDSGESTEPNVDLSITYSHLNAIGSTAVYPSVLQDDDGNGGYTFQYHTDFDTSSAKTYFEEAFGLWNCESNVNFTFSGTTTTDESVNDGINIVRFDNGSELATGVLGQVTTRFLGTCSTTKRAIVSEMDITWNDSTNWYYGSDTPSGTQYDFKSVALHELGHAHQLGHVIDSNVIMHYNIGTGVSKYSLDQNDIDGANYTMGLFTQSAGCGVSAMTDNIQCCDTMVITTQPQSTTVEANNGTAQFTIVAENYDTVQWEESGDGGDTWFTISDNTIYSGTTTTTLSVTDIPETSDLYYRAILSNVCGDSLTSSEANLMSIQYTQIPDSNFEAALEALGYDDISGDNKVPTANIENLTSLIVTNASITDLSGIEDFRDLETLNYSSNSVTTVDLSNNSALKNIAARYNGITTTIDVSANTALEKLFLENNSVTSIDLSNNPNLIAAWFQNNNLTSIDVSNNPALTALGIQGNSITNLDVSNNTLLAQLYAGSNSITSVDLSNNPDLFIVGLNGNDLSSLNIQNGNNTAITTFSLADNPNLTCILVDDATYSTVNWTSIDAQTSFSDTVCYTEYTSIPDTNFEAALEALGYDDISGDGQVPTALIETLTSLYVSTQNISDLTGIEDFTLLQELGVSENNLTSLDLSSNTNMMFLVADDNQLNSINVSNLANLSLLNIHTNQLTSLDLTSNTSLTEVYIYNNDLQVLDIRNGNNTSITNFEATNNTNLDCISVDDATYSATNWTNIDAQTNFTETAYCGYTQIPDANFEAALETLGYDDISSDGQVPTALIEGLTELNVNSQSITDLTGIEDFIALQKLYINSNSISVLDLSNLANLERLWAYGNNLTTLDLSNNTLVWDIRVENNQLTSVDFSTLTQLVILQINANQLSEIDLSNSLLLERARLYDNNFTNLDFSNHPNITELTVENNDLSSLNFKNGNNTNASVFRANGNDNLTCILVDDAAYSTTNWTNIDAQTSFSDTYCEYTQIPDANFEAALETLGYDDISADGQVPTELIESITTLSVGNKNISDFTGIEDFTSIQSLYVHDNPITTIDLSNNLNLSNFRALRCNLSSLDLSTNTSLSYLDITDNDLTELNLANNIALTTLICPDNLLSSLDVSNITVLEELEANNNLLTSLTLGTHDDLVSLLLDNNELTELDLSAYPNLEYVVLNDNNLTALNLQSGSNQYIFDFDITNNPDLICVLVDDATYSTTNWTSIDSQTSFNETTCDYIMVDIDVFLQGALLNPYTGEESLMRDDLRASAMINANSPYSDGQVITETINLDDNGSDSMVDWIWVELRDATDPTIVITGQSAILQRDGDVVSNVSDLATALTFNVTLGDYYIVVSHRNHLGIMTANAITLNQSATTVDFTDANNQITYGSNAQATFGMPTDTVAMWAGDVNGDGIVQYSGTSPDTPDILSEVLNDSGNFLNFPTYTINGYNNYDTNLDGETQYSGTNPDVPYILQNVLAHPGIS